MFPIFRLHGEKDSPKTRRNSIGDNSIADIPKSKPYLVHLLILTQEKRLGYNASISGLFGYKSDYDPVPFLVSSSFPNHFLALGRRCGQPGQQHGRRLPCNKSSRKRTMCSARVSSFLTIVTQQIHSFRASGVSPFQSSNSFGTPKRTSFISLGTVWTTPELITMFFMRLL